MQHRHPHNPARNAAERLRKTKPIHASKSIGEVQTNIVEILVHEGELPTPVLAESMGYTKATEAVRKSICGLLASGRIEYTEPDNPRIRNQNLRLISGGAQK